jgi:hypothetical protein
MSEHRWSAAADTLITLSSDEKYFPLAKGLILSLIAAKLPASGVALAFVDIGCSSASLAWLADKGVRVIVPDEQIMGVLAHPRFGYHRAQTCRPFLPDLFPNAQTYIWLDCDTWVQRADAIKLLVEVSRANVGKIVLCPESHYSYTKINDNVSARRTELHSYYAPPYGEALAAKMSNKTMLNSGVFALTRNSQIWGAWKDEVKSLYMRTYAQNESLVRHFAEQISLNVLLADRRDCVLIDPLNNYISLWTPPYLDARGVVRVVLPPNAEIGIVHLAGWGRFGRAYLKRGLLYSAGSYLSVSDENHLLEACRARGSSVPDRRQDIEGRIQART